MKVRVYYACCCEVPLWKHDYITQVQKTLETHINHPEFVLFFSRRSQKMSVAVQSVGHVWEETLFCSCPTARWTQNRRQEGLQLNWLYSIISGTACTLELFQLRMNVTFEKAGFVCQPRSLSSELKRLRNIVVFSLMKGMTRYPLQAGAGSRTIWQRRYTALLPMSGHWQEHSGYSDKFLSMKIACVNCDWNFFCVW